ncbi:NAD kinase [Echinicola strongylocentroti]|uniref:NAD kinase n=1 Tax=Echinicola strongylocentroti TaxID=1795355 RepID=A0A2Z4II22_9BACT|nr:NAD kinase [Echinicola strongylocentroti]AWW30357.1 NAD kinase [Echinicola strongylocentroti]
MKITIHGISFQKEFVPYIEKLIDVLHGHGTDLYLTEAFSKYLNKSGAKATGFTVLGDRETLEDMDFVISVGGDGTLLDTVSLVGEYEVPIVGINTGRMGFLATIAKEDVEKAVQVLFDGEFTIQDRILINLEADQKLFNGVPYGLNEFTVHKRDTSSMIIVHTYIDGEYLNSYWADGLIVATPTGSTGYSLSCGGPLISPSAKNFVITPVSPHNLNVRPMIVSDESEISFSIEGRSKKFLISLDSRSTAVDASVKLKVKREKFVARLVKFHDYSFFDTLRKKLNWGFDMRN